MSVQVVEDQVEARSRKKPKMQKTADRSYVEIVDVEEDFELDLKPLSPSSNGTTKSNAISVEQYTEDRDLQLALMASLLQPHQGSSSFIDLSLDNHQHSNYDEEEVRILMFEPNNASFRKRRKPFTGPSLTETGHSSNSKIDPSFICEICVEPKSQNESFSIKGCIHSYCKDCMVKYVGTKLQENVTCIQCPVPDCKGLLEPEHCSSILPYEVFNWWVDTLCEAVILGSEKFYCPFKDCSALLINDGTEVIRESECPNCRRMFCAQCKVGWHAEIDCDEFQKLNKDEREKEDVMLMNLAKGKRWSRCPACKFYVEKSEGCLFMKCRCGTSFCYSCGTRTTKDHHCSKCNR